MSGISSNVNFRQCIVMLGKRCNAYPRCIHAADDVGVRWRLPQPTHDDLVLGLRYVFTV
jgi:hypothetical protein